MPRSIRRVVWLALAAPAVLLAGCPETNPPSRSVSSTPSSGDGVSITPALETLEHLEGAASESGLNDLTYHLNRWSESHRATGDGKPDELVERLPRQLRELIPVTELARPTFDRHDARYLQESSWLRDISIWVSRGNANGAIADWLRGRTPALEREQADNLLIAERLFDWTIRNIQLNPLLPYPSEGVAGPTAGGGGGGQRIPPFAVGIPGPGYMRLPWQILLHGVGDAWERARIFTLLARQQDIEVVTLAIYNVKVSPRPQPWLSAALIGGELFLFDTALGLPLPLGTGGDGIATFAEVREHPEWLAAMDLDEKTKYPVQGPDLANVVALIEAAPPALAPRFAELESNLVGDHQIVVHVRPTEMADRLRRIPGINSVSLWTIPWEADVMANLVRRYLNEDPPPHLQARMIEESFMSETTPLVQGRLRHLRGHFANEENEKGAKGLYLEARMPDEVINNIMADRTVQERLGLVRDRLESDTSWARKLMLAQAFGRESKASASYWLGLVHFESGQYDVAADWLKARTLELPQENRWKAGARYNLARCYEKLNRSVDARLLLLEDDSPQRHGNALRARQLARRDQAGTSP